MNFTIQDKIKSNVLSALRNADSCVPHANVYASRAVVDVTPIEAEGFNPQIRRHVITSSSSATELADLMTEDANKHYATLESKLSEYYLSQVVPQNGGRGFVEGTAEISKDYALNRLDVNSVWIGFTSTNVGNIYKNSDTDNIDNYITDARMQQRFRSYIAAREADQNFDTPLDFVLYQGSNLYHSMRIRPVAGYHNRIDSTNFRFLAEARLTVSVPTSAPFMRAVMMALKKDPSWKRVGAEALKYWWDNESLPLAFDLGVEIPPVDTKMSGVVKIGTTFFYLPDPKKISYDQRIPFITKLSTSRSSSIPANQLIVLNPQGIMQYTDSNGEFAEYNMTGAMKISDEDKFTVLKKSVYDVLMSNYKGSLSNIYDYRRYGDFSKHEEFLVENSQVVLGEVDKASLKAYLKDVKAFLDERYVNLSPVTYFEFLGILMLIYQNVDSFNSLRTAIESKKKEFNAASATDVPSIPCIGDTFAFFPHQAEALAKVDKAQEIAIFDVSTGGGKTIIIISDILNLLAKGKITRPIVVMPNALCGQYASEIIGFTQGQVNAFVISTESVNSWGADRLWESVRQAPKNTIFVVSYEFLSNPSSIERFDWGDIYHNVETIKAYVQPDYVALDEAHFIKNETSNRHNAVMQLSSADYRRIATGTLITNNPLDLPGQIAFLDPMAVGDRAEFEARYAIRGNASNGWKSDADSMIREDLQLNMYYLNYREKDWAAFLPEVVFSDYFVPMTRQQTKIYKSLVSQIMDEIKSDPSLMQAWMRMQEMGEEAGLDYVSPMILPLMQKLEQYLTAPDISEFASKILSAEDKISPKMAKIDECIEKSVSIGNKVIVGVHFRYSAMHLWRHSRFKDVALYYDGAHKQNLQEFKNNPNVKVIFAVIQSITEGHNLQMADRIVIADVDWTPGKLKQFIARIYRPHIKKGSDGELKNLNAGKTVYIDTILCNNSADCVKWSLQTFKKIFNSRIMEKCPVELPPLPSFSEEALTGSFESPLIRGDLVRARSMEYNSWLKALVENARIEHPNLKFIRPPAGAELDNTKAIDVPWVRGMQLPVESTPGGTTLSQWMEDNGLNVSDYRDAKSSLVGLTVLTDSGYGVVKRVNKSTLTVKLEDGNAYNVTPGTAIKVDNARINVKRAAQVIKKDTRPVEDIAPLQEQEAELLEHIQSKANEWRGAVNKARAKVKEKYPERLEAFNAVAKPKDLRKYLMEAYNISEEEAQAYVKASTPDESAKIMFFKGTPWFEAATKGSKASEAETPSGSRKEREVKDNSKPQPKDNAVDLEFALINDMAAVIAWPSDPDTEDFKSLGFRHSRPFWEYPIKSKKQAQDILNALARKFTIPDDLLEQCQITINESVRGRFRGSNVSADELKNFFKITTFRKASPGKLKVYPSVWFDEASLVVDIATHPGVNLGRYKFHKNTDAFLYKMCKNAADVRSTVRAVRSQGLTINNLDEFRDEARQYGYKV